MQIEQLIALLSVLVAGFSPIALTHLNHKHDLKMRNFELKSAIQQNREIDSHRAKVTAFQDVFLRSSDFLSSLGTDDNIISFCQLYSSLGVASLYCSKHSIKLMDDLKSAADDLFIDEKLPAYKNYLATIEQLRAAFRQDLGIDK